MIAKKKTNKNNSSSSAEDNNVDVDNAVDDDEPDAALTADLIGVLKDAVRNLPNLIYI
jgi:hypothetical protein